METIINDLDINYKLIRYRNKVDTIVFEIANKATEVKCPYCGAVSSRVHSTYQREIQDLPIQNKKVVLLVSTRKFFCDNDLCTRKTFSEIHKFVGKNAKKTTRLEDNILYTSTQLSSVAASKILKSNHINVSKSSICVMLKKNASTCG
ncbi:MAG: transposase family protein [Pseudobutyrivibrio sp.]|nr:transposase family protein [Pseudobutyrivibrio sp.]